MQTEQIQEKERQILKKMLESMQSSPATFLKDYTLWYISDTETESAFRDISHYNPELLQDTEFIVLWENFRYEQLTEYIRKNQPDLLPIATP